MNLVCNVYCPLYILYCTLYILDVSRMDLIAHYITWMWHIGCVTNESCVYSVLPLVHTVLHIGCVTNESWQHLHESIHVCQFHVFHTVSVTDRMSHEWISCVLCIGLHSLYSYETCVHYIYRIPLRPVSTTGWRRLTGCLNLHVNFRKRATNYMVLLRKITYKDKASYDSTLRCAFIVFPVRPVSIETHTHTHTHTYTHTL